MDTGILTTIEALLAKAESTTFEAERDALVGKAQELMTKHAINEAVLRRAKPGERGEVGETSIVLPAGVYQSACLALLSVAAEANHCRAYYVGRSRYFDGPAKAYLVGYEDDRRAAEMLFDGIMVQLAAALASPDAVAQRQAEPPGRRAQWNRTFALAYAGRLGERLAQANSTARSEAESEHGAQAVAIALRDIDAAVDDYWAALDVRTGRSSATLGAMSAWVAGDTAAATADIGQPRVPPTRRALGLPQAPT